MPSRTNEISAGKMEMNLDLRAGGLGDNWMRLVGFYVAAALRPEVRIRLTIPSALVPAGHLVFNDRLQISSEPSPRSVIYTTRGLRDILGPALRGRCYASPYGRVVIHDWGRWRIKDRLNSAALTVCDALGMIYSPPWSSLSQYQGYLEVVTIGALRGLSVSDFDAQLIRDFSSIVNRMQSIPTSKQFALPVNLAGKVVAFPAGTGRQFIPLEWARAHLPDAVYAFFHGDPDLQRWRQYGFCTVPFFTPGDILALAKAARVALTTDSFPSHVLQYSASRLVVMLTGTPHHRVISPAFKGVVVPSLAPCHPCPHLERNTNPGCKAGHFACLNWSNPEYAARIVEAIKPL